jgi:ATP-dependent RNA helicase DeaD
MTDSTLQPIPSNDKTFADLGLIQPIVDAITALGYEAPTPIQEQTIGLMLAGHDVIGQAQTGTGKTAAFSLPLLQQLNPKKRETQALILTPTRELAIQVAEAIFKYSKHIGITVVPVYGGVGYNKQIEKLQGGVHVVVGTPGRVMDHIRRDVFRLDSIKHIVLDEADEMLNMGFLEDVEWVLERIPAEHQTALFSATMSPPVRRLAEQYLNDPREVLIAPASLKLPQITQRMYVVPAYQKMEALTRLLDTAEEMQSALIFCRTKTGASELTEALQARGYAADALHGDMTQQSREMVIRKLRKSTVDIVVATDVAARGIDIENISHVINYDLPSDVEYYVHRIGRTGRAGRNGVALTLVTQRELRMVSVIERALKIKIERARVPSEAAVAANRANTLTAAVQTALDAETPVAYLKIVEQLGDDYSLEQIAAALLRMYDEQLQPRSAALSATGIDPDTTEPRREEPRTERYVYEEEEDDERPPRVRLFISKGSRAGIRVNDIVGAIANECNIPGREIGPVTVHGGFSFAEIPARYQRKVVERIGQTSMRGVSVTISIAKPREE